jgi:hypothetical protein
MRPSIEHMNLRRHFDVLWRFRLILIVAAVLGIVLATLAVFRPTSHGLEWRAEQTWTSQSTVFVTQKGFPWGRVILPGPQSTAGDVLPPGTAPQEDTGKKSEQFADPGRFSTLGILYSYFAKSESVRSLMRPMPDPDAITVAPVPASQNTTEVLPLLTIETSATTGPGARKINTSAIDALTAFLEREQDKNNIKADDRVLLEVLNPPGKPVLFIGRSKTPAAVAFILVMALALALAYCLDNLYPRLRHAGGSAEFEEIWAVPNSPAEPEPARRAS